MTNYKHNLRLVFVISLLATLGSLYLSEIRDLPPCILCWYQRIFMYPIALLTGLALWRGDENIWPYVLSLSIPGALIASYHYLLQLGVIPDSLAPCTFGVSCTTVYLEYLGFITIPFMSLLGFAAIIILSVLTLKNQRRNE